jgi:putative oxidoreductase
MTETNQSGFQNLALLVGRILIAVMLIIAAYNKFKGGAGTVAYFTRLGVPMPNAAAPVVELFEVVVGLALILGYKVRCCAIAVAVFVLVAGLFAHTNFADGNQLNHFLKNLAIAGGCLALFVAGAGAYSLDGRRGT